MTPIENKMRIERHSVTHCTLVTLIALNVGCPARPEPPPIVPAYKIAPLVLDDVGLFPRFVYEPGIKNVAIALETGEPKNCIVANRPEKCAASDNAIALSRPISILVPNVTSPKPRDLPGVIDFIDPSKVDNGDKLVGDILSMAREHHPFRCDVSGDRPLCRYFLEAKFTDKADWGDLQPRNGIAICEQEEIGGELGAPMNCIAVLVNTKSSGYAMAAIVGFARFDGGFYPPVLSPEMRIFLSQASALSTSFSEDRVYDVKQAKLASDNYDKAVRGVLLRLSTALSAKLSLDALHLSSVVASTDREISIHAVDPGYPSDVFDRRLRVNAEVRIGVRDWSFCDSIAVLWPKDASANAKRCLGIFVEIFITVSNKNTDNDTDWRRASPREMEAYSQAVLNLISHVAEAALRECRWGTTEDMICN